MPTNGSRHSTLGILWVIYGLICIVKAAGIVVYSATLTLMWGALLNRVADPFFWMNLFHTWLIGAVVVLILTAIFSFVAAVTLMQSRGSGRALTLVASVLAIITGPLGIALGTYTMIVTVGGPADQSRANFASAA
jgi:ABC-type spermidine/putrescine transport system permease subunit II